MELTRARKIAEEVMQKLAPYCEKIEIAGSIRRCRPLVNDIDLVAIPSNQGHFAYQLHQLGHLKMDGQKIIRVQMPEITLDVYVATPETWATLLLIRTGSKEHNIMMCSRAKRMSMKLHADGSGLFAPGEQRVAGDTEESIFKALGLPYKEPGRREY